MEYDKVLVIVYYWPPSGGAGVQRWVKLTKYLARSGLEVHVITVDENYASYLQKDPSLLDDISGDVRVTKTRSFEVIRIFARLFGEKKVPTAGFYNLDKKSISQNLGMIIRSNLLIPDPRKGWNRYAYRSAVRLIRKENIRAVITSSPPHSSQLIGLKLRKKLKIKWIADFRDPWTDIYYYPILKHSLLSKWIDKRLEHKVLKKADRIITVSDRLKDIFSSKGPDIDPGKIHVIPNGYDVDDFPETSERKKNTRFTICYTGAMTDQYEPEAFLRAFKKLADKHSGLVKLQLIGSISDKPVSFINSYGIKAHVEILPAVPHRQITGFMTSADTLLLVIPNVTNAELILTGKLFEYLAAGRPIICLGPVKGDAARIIADCKAGRSFDRTSETAISSYLEELFMLYENNQQSAQQDSECVKRYSRESQARQIINSFL